MNIIEAIRDEEIFGPFLGNDLRSWRSWLVALRALYGIPIKNRPYTRKLIHNCTGRSFAKLPKDGFSSALFLTGRRSGKSKMSAIIGAYSAVLAGLEKRLSKGETGLVCVVCPTIKQGHICKNYMRGICETDLLKRCISQEDKDGFTFTNGVKVAILPGDFRRIRGYTLLTAIVDEVCFLGLDENSRVRSDAELIAALEPSLATCNGRLIAISSPYAKKGWAYETWKSDFGNDAGHTLVWRAPSRTMNKTLDQRFVDRAMQKDLPKAKSEYYAEWREDVGVWLNRDVIEGLVVHGRKELMPDEHSRYHAFVDVSGGRGDSGAIAIAHKEKRTVVIDYIREWKSPANPFEVISLMIAELHRFGLRRVTGDNYAAEFVAKAFNAQGIKYDRCEKPKSQLYAELLPLLCSNQVELLDDSTLVNQLAGLERHTRSGGRDVIDHPPKGHDDVSNVCAGAAVIVSKPVYYIGAPRHRTTPMERTMI